MKTVFGEVLEPGYGVARFAELPDAGFRKPQETTSMRAVLTDSKTGEIAVHEIPMPDLQCGGILVETRFSVVSSGTERAKIEAGENSLLEKARARPGLVRQVMDFARANGLRTAYQKVKTRLSTLAPLGYSSSDVVLEAGEGVTEFRPGDQPFS